MERNKQGPDDAERVMLRIVDDTGHGVELSFPETSYEALTPARQQVLARSFFAVGEDLGAGRVPSREQIEGFLSLEGASIGELGAERSESRRITNLGGYIFGNEH